MKTQAGKRNILEMEFGLVWVLKGYIKDVMKVWRKISKSEDSK